MSLVLDYRGVGPVQHPSVRDGIDVGRILSIRMNGLGNRSLPRVACDLDEWW